MSSSSPEVSASKESSSFNVVRSSTESSSSHEMRVLFNKVKPNFENELKKNIASYVCVFQVPKSLSSTKPEAYTPQLIGLGPYHHLQPHLVEMERVKLDAVKKLRKNLTLDDFTDKLSRFHPYVCSCYHKIVELDDKVLPWIMTVDSLFLFDLLRQCGINKKVLEETLKEWPDDMPGLANRVGKKLAEDAILRDVMMLENQIPIFFVKEVLMVGCPLLEPTKRENFVERLFPLMLEGFCLALSPLKARIEYPDGKALKRAHLLDLLYSMVVRRDEEFEIRIQIEEEDHKKHSHCRRLSPRDRGEAVKMALAAYKLWQHLEDAYPKLKDAFKSFRDKEAPAEEKALTPTASSLAKAGVEFSPTDHIEDISFKKKGPEKSLQTKRFQKGFLLPKQTPLLELPAITLGVNSEVVIRNLVAYEAMAISGPLVFARFLELMDGLIDTPDDVRLLKKNGIIESNLKDDEVARLFNGMSHSIEVKGDTDLDKTIKEVNKFYNGARKIKALKMRDRYLYGAWKVLVLVATVLFFLLTALQTFCSAYDCPSLVK
ncbi:putative UPF0481 protein At3g02645 [Rhodamnia argentea]|uniref:UPF0481 protein At3g02645 n=1 Tax=Rhodamnia argentea TaxID=178133 RepID=A0A8B8PQF0_9MYRT|nr:putative UPF0481 protein At3g02645 [Rhodamnia argentea]